MSLYLVPDEECATEPLECIECGFEVMVTPEYADAHADKDGHDLCSCCNRGFAIEARLRKLAEGNRPMTFSELRPGTNLKLFAAAMRDRDNQRISAGRFDVPKKRRRKK